MMLWFWLSANFLISRIIHIDTTNEACREEYTVSGMFLKGHTFKTIAVDSPTRCQILCSQDVRCQSYNYIIGKHICELNNRTKEARAEDFVDDPWRFYVKGGSSRAPLGSIEELPGKSCAEIKASEGKAMTYGIHWIYFDESFYRVIQATCEDKISGYTSLGIIYLVCTLANWLAPSFVGIFGSRVSMIVGGICYALFIASLIQPAAWSVYLCSVIIGYGASVIWTGQGNFLTINSTPETISRNSGIFWALLQSSLLFGNMYVYYQFKDQGKEISDSIRRTVYTVFTTICGLGICLLFLLRKPRNMVTHLNGEDRELRQDIRPINRNTERRTALESLKIAGKLLLTKDMLLLSLCFAYTGIELTFFSGVYGTCVGNTRHFPHAKRQIGLVGMLIGCGEISGGLLFGIFGKRTNRFGREPIVLLGMISHWVCFLLILFNLPDTSPLPPVPGEQSTKDNILSVFHPPSLTVAVICGFLLGFGDSCFNTQIYSILGSLYESDSAPAFALFKFVQSLTAAIAFFYSLILYLKWQLLIMVISSLFGTVGFFLVEWEARRNAQQGYAPIS